MNYINKIIHGDSIKILKNIEDSTVDIIITSPPYNFKIDYDNYDDNIDIKQYFSILKIIWKECYRVLKYSGRICINIKPMYSRYIPTNQIITQQMVDIGYLWKTEIVWYLQNISTLTAWGSYKSPSMPFIRAPYEYINVYCKGSQKKIGRKEDIDINSKEFIDYTTKLWNISSSVIKNKNIYQHPAMFPEELVHRLLKLFSYKTDLVLDPFCGSGTTCAVAKKLNRNYIGIDQSEKYCKIAEDRLSEIIDKENYE